MAGQIDANAITQEINRTIITLFTSTATEICTDPCLKKPSSGTLSNRDETCIRNCVSQFGQAFKEVRDSWVSLSDQGSM